jgi:hypothetical protein
MGRGSDLISVLTSFRGAEFIIATVGYSRPLPGVVKPSEDTLTSSYDAPVGARR